MLLLYLREFKYLLHLNKFLYGISYEWNEKSPASICPISKKKAERYFKHGTWIVRLQISLSLISMLVSILRESPALSFFVLGCTIWQLAIVVMREANAVSTSRIRNVVLLLKSIIQLDRETASNRTGILLLNIIFF
jgi:hypothetical protein